MKFALWVTTIVAYLAVYCVFHADGAGSEDQGAGASGSGHDEATITQNQDTESKRILYMRMFKLFDLAIPPLLNIFRKRWALLMELELEQQNSINWVDGHDDGEMLFQICTNNAIPMTDIMKKKIRDGDTTKWDVTVVLSVIQAITKRIKKIQKGRIMSNSQYAYENRHIRSIRKVHNKISHSSKCELTEQEFGSFWPQMTKALVGLGVAEMDMEKIKTMDFTATKTGAQSEAEHKLAGKHLGKYDATQMGAAVVAEANVKASSSSNDHHQESSKNEALKEAVREEALQTTDQQHVPASTSTSISKNKITEEEATKQTQQHATKSNEDFIKNLKPKTQLLPEVQQYNINEIVDEAEPKRIFNYLRIHKLLDLATKVFLHVFHKRWARLMELEQQQNTVNWADGHECGERLFQIYTEKETQMNDFMKKEINDGKASEWDVTVLLSAVQVITKKIKSIEKELNMITVGYAKENKHFHAIRTVRNDIAHSSKSELTDDEFEQVWQKMSNALAALGVDKMGMEKIKSMDFTSPTRAQSEADQIKAKANVAFKAGKFVEAIDLYTRILHIEGLSADYQADIYSNRSGAYLRQADNNDASSLSNAISDAKLAVQMRPKWWRGYHRLGMAYKSKGRLEKALEQLETVLTLEPPQEVNDTVRDEINSLRHQIGVQSEGDDILAETIREEVGGGALTRDIGVQTRGDDDYLLATHPVLEEEEEREIKVQLMHGEFQDVKAMTEDGDVKKGNSYRDGLGVKQDYTQAAKCYSRAAAKGNPEGMYNLARLYNEGKGGIKQDFARALYWLKRAAETKSRRTDNIVEPGIVEAQHALGVRYTNGIGGVKKDYTEAAKWYQMAVDNGFGLSANCLGLLYRNGWGVERSREKAFGLFKFAASRGDPSGMMNLANAYVHAEGTGSGMAATPDDIKKAMNLLERAKSMGGDTYAIEIYKSVIEKMHMLAKGKQKDILGTAGTDTDADNNQHVPASPSVSSSKNKLTEEEAKQHAAKPKIDDKAATSSNSQPADRCVQCWGPASMPCVKCGTVGQEVYYCSQKCQRKDWTDHKHFCALPFPEKKLAQSVYGILLREHAKKPEVVEVPIVEEYDSDIEEFIPMRKTGQFFSGQPHPFVRDMPIYENPYKDKNGNFPKSLQDARPLENALYLGYDDNFMGSTPNKCVKAILGGAEPPHCWAGPLVVYKRKGKGGRDDYLPCIDIELADGADIVAHFRFYGSDYQNRNIFGMK